MIMFSQVENSGTSDYQTVQQDVEFGVGEEAADERKSFRCGCNFQYENK